MDEEYGDFAATVAVAGRFHAFELAKQLERRGLLEKIVTSYPKFACDRFGVARQKCVPVRRVEAMKRFGDRVSRVGLAGLDLDWLALRAFDRQVVRSLPAKSDLFVGWSGSCVEAFRRCRREGIRSIVERGSCHILYQERVLQEEFERWGVARQAVSAEARQRELEGYQLADYVMVPSSFARQTFIEAGIAPNRVLQLPYGVALDEFYPEPQEDNVFRVLHCGAVSYQKGVPYLLQAFAELSLPGAELWLVGAVERDFIPMAHKYESSKIRFLGHRPQRELRAIYSQCSVFCLASVQEGMAMVQVQAMACGLPVIHSECTGGADLVRDGSDGFSVGVRDVEGLKRRLLELYEDRNLCREMGESALRRARSGFTWDDYGRGVAQIYRSALLAP